MALFPITDRLAGDSVAHFVAVDPEDAMELRIDLNTGCLGGRPRPAGTIVTSVTSLDVWFHE